MNYMKIVISMFLIVAHSFYLLGQTNQISSCADSSNLALYDSLVIHNPAFKTADLRFEMDYEGTSNSFNVIGSFKIIRDSVIWFTFSPGLGIEAVRGILTPDSVKFVNRLSNTYFKGNYAYPSSLLGTQVNYRMFQALLIDEFFLFPDTGRNHFATKYCCKDTGSIIVCSLDTLTNLPKVKYTNQIIANSLTYKPLFVHISNTVQQQYFKITYENFTAIKQQKVPFTILIVAQSVTGGINCKINYKRVIFNEPVTVPFAIPESYTRLMFE